jgi:hypothetical protein
MDDMSDLQIYEISREDFEKVGRSTQEEFIRTVMELLQGHDATRAKVIDPPGSGQSGPVHARHRSRRTAGGPAGGCQDAA